MDFIFVYLRVRLLFLNLFLDELFLTLFCFADLFVYYSTNMELLYLIFDYLKNFWVSSTFVSFAEKIKLQKGLYNGKEVLFLPLSLPQVLLSVPFLFFQRVLCTHKLLSHSFFSIYLVCNWLDCALLNILLLVDI